MSGGEGGGGASLSNETGWSGKGMTQAVGGHQAKWQWRWGSGPEGRDSRKVPEPPAVDPGELCDRWGGCDLQGLLSVRFPWAIHMRGLRLGPRIWCTKEGTLWPMTAVVFPCGVLYGPWRLEFATSVLNVPSGCQESCPQLTLPTPSFQAGIRFL